MDGLVAWFEELLRRPRPEDAIWLVAELDGQVVGDVSAWPGTAGRRRRIPAPPATSAGPGCLLTRSACWRRTGAVAAGAQLMAAAEGVDRGAVRSVLTTYHASPLSVPFYEQGMGYERRSIASRSASTPNRPQAWTTSPRMRHRPSSVASR